MLVHDRVVGFRERLLLLPTVPGGDTVMHCASACGRIDCLKFMVEYAEAEHESSLRSRLVEVRHSRAPSARSLPALCSMTG